MASVLVVVLVGVLDNTAEVSPGKYLFAAASLGQEIFCTSRSDKGDGCTSPGRVGLHKAVGTPAPLPTRNCAGGTVSSATCRRISPKVSVLKVWPMARQARGKLLRERVQSYWLLVCLSDCTLPRIGVLSLSQDHVDIARASLVSIGLLKLCL